MHWLTYPFRAVAGPAAVAAAGSMGAGSVATLILAGAWFGYDLLWVAIFVLPFLVIAVDTSSRIGSVNAGEGLFSLVRRRIHPAVAWMLLVIVVPVHIFVAMGQLSVMTSAFLSLFGVHPPVTDALPGQLISYFKAELMVSVLLACAVLWLILFRGYNWMQKVMTTLLILMFLCFMLIALRSFGDADTILLGLVPNFPADLPVPGRDTVRLSSSSLIAIVGSAIAPGALLAIPYLSADARDGGIDLKRDFRKSVISFGLIFGAYSAFILIAGGYALHPLPNHAEIETVRGAGEVLSSALFPGARAFGPWVFSIGLFIAAMTTLIVCLHIILYTLLDMLRKPWSFSADNRLYRQLMIMFALFISIIAPLWSFPAMLKVVLLMGVNVLVLPIIIAALLFLVNQRSVMGENTASLGRNVMLIGCFALTVLLAIANGPGLMQMLAQ